MFAIYSLTVFRRKTSQNVLLTKLSKQYTDKSTPGFEIGHFKAVKNY